MGIYDALDKRNAKQGATSGGVFAGLDKKIAERARLAQVPAQKEALRQQGLPVSIRKDRAEPTLVGGMIRSIIRPVLDVATNVVQAGQTLTPEGAQEAPLSSSYMGKVTGLGAVDLTKGPWEKENLNTIIKSASTGAEIASYLNAAGVGKKTIAGLTKQGVLASKKTFAEWAVKNIPQLAKEGFGQGIAYTVGSQGREYADTGKPFSLGQAATDITTSTLGNVIIPTALQKVFGPKTLNILAARAGERALKDAEILGKKIPDVGTKFDNFKPNLTDTSFTNIPSVKPEIKIEPGARFITPEVTPKNQFEIRALAKKSFGDYVANEIDFMNKTKQEVTPSLMKKLETAWNKMHPEPIQEAIPKTPKVKETILDEVPTTSTKEIPTPETHKTEAPKTGKDYVPNWSKVDEETFTKDSENMFNDMKDELPKDFDYGTFQQWSKEVRSLDFDEVVDVAMGGKKKTPNTVPEGAYLSIMKNYADEVHDIQLAKKLADSNVISKGAQTTVAAKMAKKGNVSDALRDIKTSLMKKKGIDPEKFIKEEATLIKNIQKKFKEVTDEVINSLICK